MRLVLCAALLLALVAVSVSHKHPQKDDSIDVLKTLKKAHDLGLITDDEYSARKDAVLDAITDKKSSSTSAHSNLIGNGTIYSPQLKFLLKQFVTGMPRSYADVLPTGENYWTTSIYLDVGAIDPYGNSVLIDSEIAIQERTLTRYGLNLYDGATWEIAMALSGLGELAVAYEYNNLYASSTGANENIGGIVNIRADSSDYQYGVGSIGGDMLPMITLPGNVSRVVAANGVPTTQTSKRQPGAYFYRMIGPKYTMNDPLVGDYANSWKYPWPNNDTTTPWNIAGAIHWNDWKPITGENVWGAIMGPLQVMWIMSNGSLQSFSNFSAAPPAVQLAISILPALKALQSPMGSLYHCPLGTEMFPADPNEQTNVSNENNFSAYASLRMFLEVLVTYTNGTTDYVLLNAISDVKDLMSGLEGWFAKYLLSPQYGGYKVVFQGGHVSFGSQFDPVPINETGGFAVDCQTWGMTVLGQANVDKWYGAGTAYQIWQATKKFAGYYTPDGKLGGVGYTIVQGQTENLIWSAEWTWGAIGACEKLAHEYQLAGQAAWAAALAADAASMVAEVSKPMVRCANSGWCGGGLMQEDGSFLYANARFFIPWGWYANPIGSTCSTAWAVMYQHKYNPFILGGGFTSPIALD